MVNDDADDDDDHDQDHDHDHDDHDDDHEHDHDHDDDVEDDVESHDRSWEGGGPDLLVVAGHVGVEGIADSEAGTQLRHEETEE